MAKILITTKPTATALKNCVFRYEKILSDYFTLISFKKLRVDHENLFMTNSGDFVASAGTMVYQGVIGIKSLENIYNVFNGNINEVRRHCIGNYTLAIKKNDKLYIFGDDNGTHDLYFKIKNDEFTIGTSLYDVAILNSNDITLDQKKLIQFCAQYCLIGGETFFKEIFKLKGSESIVIDLINQSSQVVQIPTTTEDLDENEDERDSLVSKMTLKLDDYINIIKRNFDRVTMSMTGGLDSRMLLASLLRNNVKTSICYGVGNTSITNTKDEDLKINRLLASRYRLSLDLQDWSNPDPIDLNWSDLMHKYGFLSSVYSGGNLFAELEKGSHKFIEYGYFGEPFRNVDWLENRTKQTFSLDQFLEEFYFNKEVYQTFNDASEHYKLMRKAFAQICKENNLNPSSIDLNDFQVLHNAYRKNADSVMLNLTNLFCYSASILSQIEFTEISEKLTKEEKSKAKFMLQVLNALFPDILKVPIFSHTKKWIFNPKKLVLERKWGYSTKLIGYIKQKLKRRLSFLEKTYSKFSSNKTAKEINSRELLRDYFREKTGLENSKKINHLNFLAKYSQNKFIVDSILNKKEN